MPDVGSSWLDEVNRAMRLPPAEGRALLDDMIAQRRQRAAELRARISSGEEDMRQQGVIALMAAWVDDSIDLLERARAHVVTRSATGRGGASEPARRAQRTGPTG